MRKALIPAILYLLINVLFVDKYTLRITEWHYLCDVVYLIMGTGFLFVTTWLHKQEWQFKTLLWVTGGVYMTCMIWLQYQIDPMSLQVDRWSAIHHFLDNLFQGIYPYAAQTHLEGYGSPFPVWQVLHIPFYAIGNVGLSFFAALILFLYILARYESPRTTLVALLLMAASPAINYEIVVRSDLITNFIVVCSLCEWLRSRNITLEQHIFALAIVAGLLASTRVAAVIPLAFLYGYAFLQLTWERQIVFIFTAAITFALTFLPFALWDGTQLFFFEYNPFVLQTRQGNPIIFIIFALLAIGVTVYKKNDLQYFNIYAGALLSLLVVITFTYNMAFSGNHDLYSSAFDITYFNMALPFYICEVAIHSSR